MMKFVAKNYKVIGKGLLALIGASMAIICGKSVIDETLYEERELGDVVTNNDAEEEDMF